MGTPAGEVAVQAVGAADGPPVLLLHSWWGITPAMHQWASDLAGVGRRVWLPDLYGGKSAATITEAEELSEAALSDEAAARLIDQCAGQLAAGPARWAALGFSMGGYLACGLAGRGTGGPDELVLFYGCQPPVGEITRTRRVTFHVAPDDEYCTDEEIAAAEAAFRAAGAAPDVYTYVGSHHWFAEPGSQGFREHAYELARSRVLDELRA
jgi:carboxymethylenebutenolidase